ncbi:stress response protein NST1-like [Populus alba x Populus x berolinensis]|nr:stress response protein NST1-like [Populus alba x Populus x berolinensis]
MPHPHDHCLGRKRGYSEKRPQKGGENERTRGENEQGVFFRKLRKITENRENANRGEKKTREQRTDENKRKGMKAREKDQNRRTELNGTNNTGEQTEAIKQR